MNITPVLPVVRTCFGKLWKFVMPFSKNWKVLEKGGLSIRLWRSFWCLFGKILSYPKMKYISFVHFTVYNIEHPPPKQSYALKIMFFYLYRVSNANKNVFHGFRHLVIWLWRSFGNILKTVCVNPVLSPTDPVLPPTDPVLPPTDPVLPPTDPVLPPTDSVLPPTDSVLSPTDPDLPPTDPKIPYWTKAK